MPIINSVGRKWRRSWVTSCLTCPEWLICQVLMITAAFAPSLRSPLFLVALLIPSQGPCWLDSASTLARWVPSWWGRRQMGRSERHGGSFSVQVCSFLTYWAEQWGAGALLPPLTQTFLWFLQLPEQCRLMHIQPPKKKNKHKHKQSRTQDPVPPGKQQFYSKPETWCSGSASPILSKKKKKARKFLTGSWTPKFSWKRSWCSGVSWANRTLGKGPSQCLHILSGHLNKSSCPWLGVGFSYNLQSSSRRGFWALHLIGT